MGCILGPVNVLTLQYLVWSILFGDLHDGEDFTALSINQGNFFFHMNAVCEGFVAGKRNGYRPEHAVFKPHIQTNATPAAFTHEPFNGCIGAHGHH